MQNSQERELAFRSPTQFQKLWHAMPLHCSCQHSLSQGLAMSMVVRRHFDRYPISTENKSIGWRVEGGRRVEGIRR